MNTATPVHIAAALAALIAGSIQLMRVKGTPSHRAIGWLWITAMTVVAVSSFWLKGFMNVFMGYGPIHLLSLWTLFCLAAAVHYARHGRIRQHKYFVVGAFLGLIGAGLGTLAPGRLIHHWLFGG